MLTICYSPKGGQGCTAIAVALACLTPHALLIDTAGDAPAAAGIAAPTSAGICDLLASDVPVTDKLVRRLAVHDTAMAVVPAGDTPAHTIDTDRWTQLADALATPHPVIVDAAINPAVAAMAATRRIMVIQPCYLALRRAVALPVRPDEIVLIADPRRALTTADIETALGVPVTATVELDPRVARAVDAGLFTSRLPHTLAHRLAPLTTSQEVRRDG